MSETMIECADLSVAVEPSGLAAEYNDAPAVPVLESIDLRVKAGEVVLLTGGSGSGKTSLIGALNGFMPHLRPAQIRGRVCITGMVPAEVELTDIGQAVATVFQNPRTQFFATDVLSELAFGAANQGVARAEILRRVRTIAADLDLKDLLHRRMGELSGGQRQRVAMASALVTQPHVFLLDEPTANLDAASTAAVSHALAHLKETGATILVAEHNVHYLRDHVDRVVQLERGKIIADRSAVAFWGLEDKERRDAGLRTLVPPVHTPLPSPPTGGDAQGLELRGLSVERGGRRLWTIGQVNVPRGAVTCVTGPNGVGKSTLVQVLVGLCRAQGAVRLDGKALSRRERRRRCFAVMQDVNRQLFGVSVTEELSLGRGTLAADEATAVLAELGLAGTEQRHPLSLSGGQRQRLAVATAIASGAGREAADVIIFDEPTSGLDLRAMERMAGVIRRCAERGAVVILVTHDRELVDMVGDYELALTGI